MDTPQVPRLAPGQVWAHNDDDASITIIGRGGNDFGWLARSGDAGAAAVLTEAAIRTAYQLVSDDIIFHLD